MFYHRNMFAVILYGMTSITDIRKELRSTCKDLHRCEQDNRYNNGKKGRSLETRKDFVLRAMKHLLYSLASRGPSSVYFSIDDTDDDESTEDEDEIECKRKRNNEDNNKGASADSSQNMLSSSKQAGIFSDSK